MIWFGVGFVIGISGVVTYHYFCPEDFTAFREVLKMIVEDIHFVKKLKKGPKDD